MKIEKKKNINNFPIIFAVGFIILISLISFFSISRKNFSTNIDLPSSFKSTEALQFNLYDYSYYLEKDNNIPTEITSIQPKNLLDLSCTPSFLLNSFQSDFSYKKTSYPGGVGKKYTYLQTQELAPLIEHLRSLNLYDEPIESFKLCHYDNKQLVIYYVPIISESVVNEPNKEPEAYRLFEGNDTYLAFWDGLNLDSLSTIPMSHGPYYSCNAILGLTLDNIYFACGAGDGPYSYSEYYKIDLQFGNKTLLKTCEATAQELICIP